MLGVNAARAPLSGILRAEVTVAFGSLMNCDDVTFHSMRSICFPSKALFCGVILALLGKLSHVEFRRMRYSILAGFSTKKFTSFSAFTVNNNSL